MAVEHEIDRMVVRLVGDQESYMNMLKDVERETEEAANWAEKQGNRITTAFSKAFKSAQGSMSSVGGAVSSVGSAMSQPAQQQKETFGKAALDFSEYGKSISDMVKETEKAAKEAEFLKKRLVENTKEFEELEKVIKLTNKEAAVFKQMSERTGLSVAELTKVIKIGSKEYENFRKETEKFGRILDDESIKKAKELADSWIRVRQAVSGVWTQLGSIVANRFKEINDRIVGVVTWVNRWIERNKELIARSVELTAKIGIAGTVITTLGTVLTTVSTLLGPIAAALAAGAAAWTLWNRRAEEAANAVNLWDDYVSGIKNAVAQVMTYGRQIIDFTKNVMDSVFDSIKAGELELAVEIAWAGAKVAWTTALMEIDVITKKQFSAIFHRGFLFSSK